MSIGVGVLILCVHGVVLQGFMPECDVYCGFVIVMVLYVLGNVLEAGGPIKGVVWWRCWWINPHGDEAVGWALLIVIDN